MDNKQLAKQNLKGFGRKIKNLLINGHSHHDDGNLADSLYFMFPNPYMKGCPIILNKETLLNLSLLKDFNVLMKS